jgi:hypothetical protein
MQYAVEVFAPIIFGTTVAIVVALMFASPTRKLTEGELRCEGAGAVIVNVAGEDYAVNSLAGWRFSPIQLIWNKGSFPETNIEALIVRGLTLCDRKNFATKR